MDITAPSALTDLNTTSTERLQRYLDNYDTGIINNWRFTAGQRFQDELARYEEVKQGLITPFEVGASLPEINHLVRKGGAKIDRALGTIKNIKENPQILKDVLDSKISPETREAFADVASRIQQFPSDVKARIDSARNVAGQMKSDLKNATEPPRFKSMSQVRKEITPEEMQEHPLQRSGGLGERGYHQDEGSSSREVPEENNYQDQLVDAKNEDDQIKSIEQDKIEGVSGETPVIEEQAGKLATSVAEEGVSGLGSAVEEAGTATAGAVEGALGATAEFLGPVAVAGMLGYGLYNLFDHGLHVPHPTSLKEIPRPELPSGINFNSVIRPHLSSVMDHSSGLTNF